MSFNLFAKCFDWAFMQKNKNIRIFFCTKITKNKTPELNT